jgi:t-SNARE complex subunit (syntaxin)
MGLGAESVGRIERKWDVECGMWNKRNNGKIWANKSIKKSSTSRRHAKVQTAQIIIIIIILVSLLLIGIVLF